MALRDSFSSITPDTKTGKTVSAEEVSEIVAELVAMYEDASSDDE